MTTVTRLCVDQLRLAHVQREAYAGVWLPEPLLQSPENDPARLVEVNESISTAFLVLLESLSPLDRAVFLLHEVFGYTFAEIATIVDRSPANCRQIGHRARQRVKQARPRFEVETEAVEEAVQHFLNACAGGDLSELLALLSPDVTVTNDSGGKVSGVRNMLAGADKVARLFLGIFRRWYAQQDTAENDTLQVLAVDTDIPTLEAQVQATLEQLAVLTSRIQQVTAENNSCFP